MKDLYNNALGWVIHVGKRLGQVFEQVIRHSAWSRRVKTERANCWQ